MLCPNCKTENLITSERQNVQIDHCPQCRGVWLDRGELEKLIQMASTDDDRHSEPYNGRDYGEEDAPRKRGYGEKYQEDDDDDERGESYQSRERGDDDRGDSYRSRDRDYDPRSGRDDQEGGRSIWREIFENLGDRLPRP